MYYSIFTPKVSAEQAVLKAVNYCIEHDIRYALYDYQNSPSVVRKQRKISSPVLLLLPLAVILP